MAGIGIHAYNSSIGEDHHEVKTNLGNIVSSKPSWGTEFVPCLKQNKHNTIRQNITKRCQNVHFVIDFMGNVLPSSVC